ncbi:tyrosine-type recombinase/integrase [Chryseobacterium sp. SC28]|uniref:tyrosine-type recombinase/integrase n=1 Tax=Chryseobacterium sp. SC28 TaxID=2268028 RepID=UPI001E55DD9D|nr:tyrosine-type recombinase/integrase [Chryseobacterium sp. SC28]
MLKTEGLPYSYLHLPAIPKVKKLPTILSREEIWRMLQSAELLKHKLLIGLIYGCGLRCMEVRNIKLQHLDFDRKMLLNKCRCCKQGNLVAIAVFGQRGPPQDFLFVTQSFSAE